MHIKSTDRGKWLGSTLREHGLGVLSSFVHPVKILMIEGRVFRHESKKI